MSEKSSYNADKLKVQTVTRRGEAATTVDAAPRVRKPNESK